MLNIAVLVSGGGSNLQALLDSEYLKDNIKLVFSNRKKAYGLERAKNNNIEALYISGKDKDYDKKLLIELKKRKIDLVVLAGYLKVLDEEFVNFYKDKIINIHPSLIPSFCGKGFYGMKVHEAVKDRGVKLTGATVHFVDKGTDTGPIIIQRAVDVKFEDSAESIQKKVLKIEHQILPEAVKLFCENKLEIKDGRVKIL